MKLESKKALASRALKIGLSRIIFNTARLSEIKEAITKQDIKDLKSSGAISIREVKGRKKIKRRTTRRRAGSIKKNVNTRKQDYVILTRKLRTYINHLKISNAISYEDYKELRKEVRNSTFRSLSHMKERVSHMMGEKDD